MFRLRPARSGVPVLLLAAVLWGSGGLVGTLLGASSGLSPLAVAAHRLLVGGGLLLLVTRTPPAGRAAWRRVLATGALAALFQAAFFSAVALTSVSLATLVTIGSSPVLVLLVRRRHVRRGQVVGVGLALAGLALLVGAPSGGAGPGLLAGAACALLAGGGFAAMTLLAERPVPGLDAGTTTAWAFVLGGLLLAPLAGPALAFTPDARSVALLLLLGAVPTALAYTCFFRGMRRASASTGAVLALVEPLTAAVLAAVVLGERLGLAGGAGAVLLACAVVLVGRQERARSS